MVSVSPSVRPFYPILSRYEEELRHLDDILSVIKKKERWQAYFQGGLIQISEQDYNTVTSG